MLKRAFSVLVLAACGVGCADVPRRDNVVVITIDTLRADALGVYGNPGGHSPHIDAFAAGAIVFEDAVTAIGTTSPSHATLFTGLYPKHHGVRKNSDRLDDRFTTLAEILQGAGYETASFVSWDLMQRRGGLGQGISTVADPPKAKHAVRTGEEVSEMAIPWLSSRGDQPFFLWLHYFEPHSPYPLSAYAREQLAGYTGPLADGASIKTFYSLGRGIPWTPEEVRAVRVLYDGRVRDVDRIVGEILEVLERQDLISGTIVLIASDHGQLLGEHGTVGHGWQLTQPVLHVPLIIRLPGFEPRRIAGRAGLVDLVPTFLDLFELAGPPGLDGTSLVPLLKGKSRPTGVYFAEVRDSKVSQPRDESIAVFDGDLKGVWKPDGWSLYDLATDPKELRPVAPDLDDSRRAALRDLAAGYHRTAIEASRPEVSDAVRKQLESLGYIE